MGSLYRQSGRHHGIPHQDPRRQPDLDAINDALTGVDPSAMADIDPVDASLRIAAELGSPELLALLARAGYPADWKQLEQVPSVCCGACGG